MPIIKGEDVLPLAQTIEVLELVDPEIGLDFADSARIVRSARHHLAELSVLKFKTEGE